MSDDIGAEMKRRDRKFKIAVFFACVTSVAVFHGTLTGAEYIEVVKWILGLYGAANVWEAIKK